MNDEPVRKKAAVQALAVAVLNVTALLFDFDGALTAALNLVVMAAVGVYDVFVLRSQVTPNATVTASANEQAHDILVALVPSTAPPP